MSIGTLPSGSGTGGASAATVARPGNANAAPSATGTDQIVIYNNPTAAYSVPLPGAAGGTDGMRITVKLKLNASSFAITIYPATATDKVNGVVNGTVVFTAEQTSYTMQLDKTAAEWMII